MLAVLAYLRAVGEGPAPRRGWLAGSLALTAAAMLCKAAAVGLPAVLLILDVYPLRRLGGGPGRWLGPAARRVWLEKLPFVALGLVFLGLAVAAKADAHSLAWEDDGVATRIARACYSTWFYLVKSAIPRDIMALYPLPQQLDRYAPPFAASVLMTLAVSAGLFALRRRWPGLLAAWLSYLVLLAPSSGLVRIGPQLAADRYSYLSMVGLVVPAAAGLGLAWASSRRSRAVAPARRRRGDPGPGPADVGPVSGLAQLGGPVVARAGAWGGQSHGARRNGVCPLQPGEIPGGDGPFRRGGPARPP